MSINTPGVSLLCLSGCLVSLVFGGDYEGYGSFGSLQMTNLNTSSSLGEHDFAKASFGTPFPDNPHFKGILVEGIPWDGCSKLTSPPYDVPRTKWVAILRRSVRNSPNSCNFSEKVYHANIAGYSAVIIYNNDPEDDRLIPMSSSNKTLSSLINIPSAFVTYDSGERLLSNIRKLGLITQGEFTPFESEYIDPYKILIPMAFSFIAILLVAIIVMVVRWCQALRRKRRSRISKSQLRKLPLVKYKSGDQFDCCAICLDDYEVGEKVRLLPCAHTYHKKCIDPWLLKNKKTCPVCKRRVVPKKSRSSNSRRDPDSSDSEDEERGENRPLLTPPIGRFRISVRENSGYGATNEGAASSGERLAAEGRSERPHRQSTRNIYIDQSSETSDSDSGGADLRNPASFLAASPNSMVFAGAHSLQSMPGRLQLRPDPDEPMLPPLPTTENHNSDPAHDSIAVHRSHDLLADTSHEDILDVTETSDDHAPLLDNESNQNVIV